MTKSSHGIRLSLIALALIASVVALRAPWMGPGIWSLDEGSTFTMAQQVLDGQVLYRDAADNRSPLMPYLKAAVLAVAGDWNATAVHASLALALGFCAFWLFLIARRLDTSQPASAWFAAGAFILLQILYIDAGDAVSANTEWYVIVFSIAAFALLARWIPRPSFTRGLPVGLLFSLAVLCKQPGLLDAIVASILIGLLAIPSDADRRGLLRFWLGMVLGIGVPLLTTLAYFIGHGAYEDYIYYAFTFNTQVYLPEVPLLQRLLCIERPFTMAWEHVPFLFFTGVGAAFALLRAAIKPAFASPRRFPLFPWLILGWTASGLVSTTLSGRAFAHYSEQVIPGLSLAIGWALARLPAWRPARWPVAGRVLLGFLLTGSLVHAVFRWNELSRELAAAAADELKVARYVARQSAGDERIFVWGYFPEIYFTARRLPATRYIYANYITGMIAWSNLDALKNVDYGVSPDGWEKFYEDFAASPPALIVDTGFARGYSKFPLEDREPLWTFIERDYAVVDAVTSRQHGMLLYRRLESNAIPLAAGEQPAASIKLHGYSELDSRMSPQLAVSGPTGISRLQLFAGDTLLASLPHAPTAEVDVRFFVPGDPFKAGPVHVRAEPASDGPNLRSTSFDFTGFVREVYSRQPKSPALHLDDIFIPPVVVDTPAESISRHRLVNAAWDFSAPARLVYPCPPHVDRITFVHGLAPSVRDLSDGYDVTVNWLPEDASPPLQLFQRRILPRRSGRDHETQSEDLALPPRPPGRLEFRFTTGEQSDANNDHLFFGQLRGYASVPVIRLGDTLVPPQSATGPNADSLVRRTDGAWLTNVPTRVTWQRPPNLMKLRFAYGIDEGAYDPAGDGHSDGVRFQLDLVEADGNRVELWSRLLEPFNHPSHRGVQQAEIDLPREPQGQLVFTTGPGHGTDSSWDWAYAGPFVGEAPGPPLRLDDGRALVTRRTAGYADGWADQFDATHWGAQTPQTLVYPKLVDMSRLTFTYGLNDNAARDENGQRRSDGVEAVLTFVSESGRTEVLHRRHLDPFVRPEDAGPQTVTVDLPLGEAGELHLSMQPGPHGNNSYDWAYWGPLSGEVVAP